jgi:hypothetical protein
MKDVGDVKDGEVIFNSRCSKLGPQRGVVDQPQGEASERPGEIDGTAN